MKICIHHTATLPVKTYGGTERDIWYLALELHMMGHEPTLLTGKGTKCPFARVIEYDPSKSLNDQIPSDTDIVQLHNDIKEDIDFPVVISVHGNRFDHRPFHLNSVFVSPDHARRYGSTQYVYNGMHWEDYGEVNWNTKRHYFHFLGNASWRVKNLRGAIQVVNGADEKLRVLGGKRLNFRMGFRFTPNLNVRFEGMVGGQRKSNLINGSKGLIFPVLWPEPMGLAVIESLYFGCPVFATPYGSLPELVGEFGFLSNSASELAEAISNVDAFDRRACHEYARDVHNSRQMALNWLEKFEQVLNGKDLNKRAPVWQSDHQPKYLEWRA
jgi:glycosyltransferase involved in cell wall biosynthesis